MPRLARLIGLLACSLLAAPPMSHAAGTVDVLYAGSLVNLMEYGIRPAFDQATGNHLRGFAGGSKGLANEIHDRLRHGDVFISADPAVDDSLYGPDHGDWVNWYIKFAEAPLVIGINATSRFAAELRSKPWYDVLMEPGIRIGRTDPKLDPKGAMTLEMLAKASKLYDRPSLLATILGSEGNPAEVLPEEALVGRLQSGQLDVGFFYSSETTEANIPAIPLPEAVEEKATYTVAILRDAGNEQGAVDFVRFLLGKEGSDIMHAHGLSRIRPEIGGEVSQVPQDLRLLVANGP